MEDSISETEILEEESNQENNIESETIAETLAEDVEYQDTDIFDISKMNIELPAADEAGKIVASGKNIKVPDEVKSISLSDESNVQFVFSSGVHLRNLQLVSLSYDGENYKREEFVYINVDFESGEMMKICTYLPDTHSNLLLQYEDPTGEFFCYFVVYDMSGDGDSVVLIDAMDAEIAW